MVKKKKETNSINVTNRARSFGSMGNLLGEEIRQGFGAAELFFLPFIIEH